MENAMPLTAKEALEMWDAGKDVPAFQIETKPERQHIVFGAAFDLIRGGKADPEETLAGHELSDREFEVAQSIATVAEQSGWAKMVSQHVHRDSPAIVVRKQ